MLAGLPDGPSQFIFGYFLTYLKRCHNCFTINNYDISMGVSEIDQKQIDLIWA